MFVVHVIAFPCHGKSGNSYIKLIINWPRIFAKKHSKAGVKLFPNCYLWPSYSQCFLKTYFILCSWPFSALFDWFQKLTWEYSAATGFQLWYSLVYHLSLCNWDGNAESRNWREKVKLVRWGNMLPKKLEHTFGTPFCPQVMIMIAIKALGRANKCVWYLCETSAQQSSRWRQPWRRYTVQLFFLTAQ